MLFIKKKNEKYLEIGPGFRLDYGLIFLNKIQFESEINRNNIYIHIYLLRNKNKIKQMREHQPNTYTHQQKYFS